MSHISTDEIAEKMLESGKPYTAASLAKEVGINSKMASAKLFNIRVSKKYQCEITDLPNRTIKIISISGTSITKRSLWDLVLFNKPLLKGVVS